MIKKQFCDYLTPPFWGEKRPLSVIFGRMKANVSALLGLALLMLTAAQAQLPLYKIENFGPNPGNLTMYLHRPCHKVDTVKYRRHKPLVVVLHGCNQDAISIT
jgi:poly(3-hydroxybutyrate) depolymerase